MQIVLTVGCGGKLTTSGEAIGHEALEEHRIEVCASEIDSCGVASWPRADDDLDHGQNHETSSVDREMKAKLTTLECILEDWGWATPFVPFAPFVVGAILGIWVEKGAAAAAKGMDLKRAEKDRDRRMVKWVALYRKRDDRKSQELVNEVINHGHVMLTSHPHASLSLRKVFPIRIINNSSSTYTTTMQRTRMQEKGPTGHASCVSPRLCRSTRLGRARWAPRP